MASDLILSAVSDILEKVIEPSIERNVYEKSALMQLFFGWSPKTNESIRKNTMGVSFDNDKVYFTVLVDGNPSATGTAEDEAFNTGKGSTAQGYLSIATETAATSISKQTLKLKNKGAIINTITFESTNLINAMAMDLNRQAYGNGLGVIATTVTSGSSATTVALNASVNGDIDYADFLPVGTRIKVGSSAAAKVTARTLNSLTVTPAISWSVGDNVVKITGSDTAASEMTGLAGIVATSGAYANITNGAWVSPYADNTSTVLTVLDMHKAFFKAQKLGSVDYIFMNQSLFAKYGSTQETNKRFAANDVLAGGWKGLGYMDGLAQVVLDYMCPDDRVYFLSSNKLIGMEYWPLQFERGTEGNLLRKQGYLNYELAASWSGQIGTFLRGAHTMLDGRTPA